MNDERAVAKAIFTIAFTRWRTKFVAVMLRPRRTRRTMERKKVAW